MKVIANQNGDTKNKKKKMINLHLQTFEQEFKREVQFLRNMNHPHIIKMVNSKMGNEDDRPKSGESRKSNKSNSSGSGEDNEQSNY